MEMILAFITGLGLAGLGAFFMLRSHKSSSAAALEKAVNDAAKQAQAEKEKDIATLTADLKNAKENLEQFKKDAEAHEKKLLEAKEDAHQAAMQEMEKHHKTALEALEQRFKDAITADKDRLDTALEALKADVKNTTTEALKQRQNEFQQTNSSSMKQIVEPLKETLQKMETALKENKSVQETSTATIKENIATLVSKAMQVSNSAERLSNALTAENKTQGCWGEQKIEALLDAIGLEKGLQYVSQEYLRDANGNIIVSEETDHRMQPDIILHLDATRDLVIDSKVSLRAFVEYTNAENDEDKSIALAAHIKSVRNHVKELAKKNYAAYVKPHRQSVDFVMMFVPIESALQLALLNDPSLWREAMNQGVFIVGEQNLYAALRAVDVTWTTIKQDANNKAICEAAAELMDRVGLLLKRVTALGKCLESANNAFLDVKDKSINGKKSVLGAAKKLEKLGAKPSTKYPLPSLEIDDDATLSLPMDSENE
jgi:DNA recombination protein RmuC